MPRSKQNPADAFEKSLAELEKIVRRMERGEQTLEQTLKDFERGMALSAQCRERLEAAQQRVSMLVKKNGGERLEPLEMEMDMDTDAGEDADGGGH